ncbi:MAG TPA: VOC family protein, partial [Acidimicrobiales bacterium]|nr:VOC family protein [Acidimicrobiales bacterium]
EAGAPAWFELRTPEFDRAVAFYRAVFGWDTEDLPGDHDIRYTTMRHPDAPMAGIFGDPEPAARSSWAVYFAVAEVDGALETVTKLGGTADTPFDSPYGRMAAVTDPYGAAFRIVAASG